MYRLAGLAFIQRLASLVLALALIGGLAGGCSVRPTSAVLDPVPRAPSYTDKVRLLVATTRERGTPTDPNAFSAQRSEHLNFAEVTVSIPTHHVAGEIEWPDTGPPDPSYDFVTTERRFLSGEDFRDAIRRSVHRSGAESDDVLVFVHGYNTLYEEAVYWMAQIVHDSGFQGTAILFAWPSRGKAPLYLADRDASTYSRDYFENFLLGVSAIPEVKNVNILAHSMGTWLAVETLRQARLKGNVDFNGKLGDVILASPDIDINVFRTQLDTIGRLNRPIIVLASGDDKALAFSTALSGGVERAGMITADDARAMSIAKRYNLIVVDLTSVDDGYGNHHSKYSKSAAVMDAIGKGLRRDAEAKKQTAAAGGVVTAVTNVGKSLLEVPAAIVGAAAQ